MKRTLSVVFVVALLITMTGTLQVSASTENTHESNNVVKAEENTFLLSCDAPDRSQYQLSQEQLDAPTDALIDSILDCPYLVDLFMSSVAGEITYDSLCKSFNGLAELENRPDAASVMLSKYADATMADSDYDVLDALYLHVLLSIPSYFENLSESEAAEYIRISEDCGPIV